MFENSHKLMFGGFKHFKGYQFEYVFNLHWELRTTDLTSGVQELNFFGKHFEWVLSGLLEK